MGSCYTPTFGEMEGGGLWNVFNRLRRNEASEKVKLSAIRLLE